jgi:hypothetical protein
VLHSGGPSGKYRSSNLFVYNAYHGYPGLAGKGTFL